MNDKKSDEQNNGSIEANKDNETALESSKDKQNETESNNDNLENKPIIYAEDEDTTLFDNSCGCEDPVDLYDDK